MKFSFNVQWILSIALFMAAICCFILILLHKWRIVEYYDIRHAKWLPRWCNFCALWWLGVILTTCWHFFVQPGSHEIFITLPLIPVFGLFLYKSW